MEILMRLPSLGLIIASGVIKVFLVVRSHPSYYGLEYDVLSTLKLEGMRELTYLIFKLNLGSISLFGRVDLGIFIVENLFVLRVSLFLLLYLSEW